MPTISKPSWVRHEGTPIYSVDIHPDGTRFATGGADSRAIVWRLGPVLDERQDQNGDSTVPRQLCALSGHEQSVNVVRWSPNGRWLATGSSDGRVGLAERAADPTDFGSPAGSEIWRLRQYLKGSSMEIWDIAWSPDSSKIASCCHDQKVYIWDMTNGGQLLATLKGHTTVVKGVVWDPIGTFLATQDDTSMIIWRVDGWKAEKLITEPFSKAPDSIMFKRPCWSSDGFLLIGAAAMMSGYHTPLLIEREKWTFGNYAVGHRGFVTATGANPAVFVEATGGAHAQQQPFFCYALADVNQMVTIWVTKQENAVAVIAHTMDRPISDLRWSLSGDVLLIASLDGTIMAVQFAENEIGKKMTDDEKESRLREKYGAGGAGAVFEDPALLALYQQKRAKQAEEAAAAAAASAQQQHQQVRNQPTAAVQTETIVKGGRRKIVPVLVSGVDTAPTRAVDPADAFKSVFATGNITPISKTSTASPAPFSTSGTPGSTPLSTTPAPTASSSSSAMDVDAPSSSSTPVDKKRGRPGAPEEPEEPLRKKPSLLSTLAASAAAAAAAPTTATAASSLISSSSSSSTTAAGATPTARTGLLSFLSGTSSPAGVSTSSSSTATTTTPLRTSTQASSSATASAHTTPQSQQQPPAWTSYTPTPTSGGTTSLMPSTTSVLISSNSMASPPPTGTSALSIMRATAINAKRAGRPRGRRPRIHEAEEMEAEEDLLQSTRDASNDQRGGGGGGSGPRYLLPLPLTQKRFAKDIRLPSSAASATSGASALADRFAEAWSSQSESLTLEVLVDIDEDGIRPPKSTIKYISKFYDSLTLLWQDHIEDKVTALTGNATHLMAVGCDSGDIYIYTPAGRRAFPTINIASTAICALECFDSTLMAVSCDGVVKLWDISLGMAKADTNLHSLMAKHAAQHVERPAESVLELQQIAQPEDGSIVLQDFVSRFAVSELGQALCLMHSGHIFGYSTMLASWACLYAPNWQKDVDKSGSVLGQLTALQRTSQRTRATPGSASAASGGYSSFHGLSVEERRQRSTAHLESQLSSAALFGTIEEYRHFAKLYVRELAELCNEKKLAEFTKTLLGPIHHTGQGRTNAWDPFVLGVPKREILDDILPEMLRPELQRLITTIKEDLQTARNQENSALHGRGGAGLRSPGFSRASNAAAAAATNTTPSATPTNLHGSGGGSSSSNTIHHKEPAATPTVLGKTAAKNVVAAASNHHGLKSSSSASATPSAAPASHAAPSAATVSTPASKVSKTSGASSAMTGVIEDSSSGLFTPEHSQQSTGSSSSSKPARSSSSVGKGKRAGHK